MNRNPDSWHLLEKTITTSSITKTKSSTNSNYDYQDYNVKKPQGIESLSATPEDDIHSVHSYYKEEFKPSPAPRVPKPTSQDSRLKTNTQSLRNKGFSYLHPSLPPSPPLSSPTSGLSSLQHSPQEGPVPLYKEPTFDITNNTNARNTYTLQNGEGKPRQEIKPAVSNPTLLQTGAHELDTPFISRAASYNSAVGYNSAEGERTNSKQRIPNTGHEVNLNAHTVHSNHNSNENYRKTLNAPKRRTNRQVQNNIIKNKMQRTPSSADISEYEGCGEASKKLQLVANFVFLTASLVLIGVGAGLLGFYRLHMLEVITFDFMLVPMIMVVGGITTLFAALFGFYVTMKEDSCLIVTYAVVMAVEFLCLVTGIVATVRLLFIIQTGLFDADVIPELALYETDPWIRYKWDTMQREFTCCGGYGYAVGYNDWKHTLMGGSHNAVPDSCCLNESPGCGANVFGVVDLRVTIQKIHLHGCLTIMMVRLESHVKVILAVFCAIGGILAIIELLTIVLACCYANQIAKVEREEQWEYDPVHGNDGYAGGGYSNQHQFSRPPSPGSPLRNGRPCDNDVSSQHETAF